MFIKNVKCVIIHCRYTQSRHDKEKALEHRGIFMEWNKYENTIRN